MSEIPRPTSRDQFRIAIICALPVEANAVEAIFDEYYDEDDDSFGQDPSDENVYVNGRIGKHYVVLAFMAGMGKCRAMTTTQQLKWSYPQIQLGLLVGVCGGIPYGNDERDIFLGDVLISDRLVQWDIGTCLPKAFVQKHERQNVQGRPGDRMEYFLDKVNTPDERHRLESIMAEQLEIIQQSLGKESAAYPGVDKDCLYPPDHPHQHRRLRPCGKCRTCGACEDGNICPEALISTCDELGCSDHAQSCRARVAEESYSPPKPALHVGPIASGDTVLLSGHARDELAAKTGVIGIEMEGIGLWGDTSCVAIKAVADYADCHKTKQWQRYAAASAAACTKALLLEYTTEAPQVYPVAATIVEPASHAASQLPEGFQKSPTVRETPTQEAQGDPIPEAQGDAIPERAGALTHSPEEKTVHNRDVQVALSHPRLSFKSARDPFDKIARISTLTSISDTIKVVDALYISSSLWFNLSIAVFAFVLGYLYASAGTHLVEVYGHWL